MTGKHYNWHRRWRLDVSAGVAEHDSGWRVRFLPAEQITHIPEIGTCCKTSDGKEWIGLHVGGDAALSSWLQAAASGGLRDPASISRRISRLMREAGELWSRQEQT